MHLDEHQVHGLVDGELSTSAAAAARDHMTGCDECRRRVVEAERAASDVEALLRGLDDPAPRVGVESIAAEAHARDVTVWRRAAGLLFAAGLVGAAYAAPGSPVPTWMRVVAEWAGTAGRAPHIVAPAPAPSVGGIAVEPGARLVIVFATPRLGGVARVSLADGAEVVVRTTAGMASFTSAEGRLVIEHRSAAPTFEIEVPRAAPHVEIVVGERRIFLKHGDRVTAEEEADVAGRFVLPLAATRPQ